MCSSTTLTEYVNAKGVQINISSQIDLCQLLSRDCDQICESTEKEMGKLGVGPSLENKITKITTRCSCKNI